MGFTCKIERVSMTPNLEVHRNIFSITIFGNYLSSDNFFQLIFYAAEIKVIKELILMF